MAIPLPQAPGMALSQGIESGSNIMNQLIRTQLQRRGLDQQQQQHIDNLLLNQAQNQRMQEMHPLNMQNTQSMINERDALLNMMQEIQPYNIRNTQSMINERDALLNMQQDLHTSEREIKEAAAYKAKLFNKMLENMRADLGVGGPRQDAQAWQSPISFGGNYTTDDIVSPQFGGSSFIPQQQEAPQSQQYPGNYLDVMRNIGFPLEQAEAIEKQRRELEKAEEQALIDTKKSAATESNKQSIEKIQQYNESIPVLDKKISDVEKVLRLMDENREVVERFFGPSIFGKNLSDKQKKFLYGSHPGFGFIESVMGSLVGDEAINLSQGGAGSGRGSVEALRRAGENKASFNDTYEAAREKLNLTLSTMKNRAEREKRDRENHELRLRGLARFYRDGKELIIPLELEQEFLRSQGGR